MNEMPQVKEKYPTLSVNTFLIHILNQNCRMVSLDYEYMELPNIHLGPDRFQVSHFW